MERTEAKSGPPEKLSRHDMGRIFLAGLALFVMHSLGTKRFASFTVYPAMSVGFAFCAADLSIALWVVLLPFWDEPRSFKVANFACGSVFLTIVVFILAWATGILVLDAIGGGFGPSVFFDVLTVAVSFFPVPFILPIAGMVWSAFDDRRSKHLGPRATPGMKPSLIAFAAHQAVVNPLIGLSILALTAKAP